MKPTLIIKQQGSLRSNLPYYLPNTSALIATNVMCHYRSYKIVLGSKSCVSYVLQTEHSPAGCVFGVSCCGFLAQRQAHPVTPSLTGGRGYDGHQENKRGSSGPSAPK